MSLTQTPVGTTVLSASQSDILDPKWDRAAFVFWWLSDFTQWPPDNNFSHAVKNTNDKVGSHSTAWRNITCHTGCISYLKKEKLKEGRVQLDLWFQGVGMGITETRTRGSWSCCICSQEAKNNKCQYSACISPFIQSKIPGPGITFKVSLTSSINAI